MLEACIWTAAEGEAFSLAIPLLQVHWAWECAVCCTDKETEHCLWDFPLACHADISSNNAFPCCPAPLSSLCQGLDLITRILHPCHLRNHQLKLFFLLALNVTHRASPHLRAVLPVSILPMISLLLLLPANCQANFSMGYPLGASADLDLCTPHCLVSGLPQVACSFPACSPCSWIAVAAVGCSFQRDQFQRGIVASPTTFR